MNTASRADEKAKTVQPVTATTDTDVVFKGDGEPKTPRNMLRELAAFGDEVGLELDDFSRGGTVEKLERRLAEMLGKEAAVFMPTGTMANHLAIRKHCGVKLRAVVQEQSHVYNDTGDGLASLSGVNLIPLGRGRPDFTLDELKGAVDRAETGRVANPIGAVVIESPVRRQAGQVVPYDQMGAITALCAERDIPTHLDGARLYMMSAATGVEPRRFAALYDSVYVSLYKYFGAPYGAMLAGTDDFIKDMYHNRRMFGGGLPSAYMAAGLALKGTEGFEERFAAAMERARAIFARLNDLPGIEVTAFEHGSNIFPMDVGPDIEVAKLVSALRRQGVFVFPEGDDQKRILLTVNTTVLRQTEAQLIGAFEEALEESLEPTNVATARE